MSKQKSQVFLCDGGDPKMQQAYERARATFRYFWREVTWEYRRIIPALDLIAVKAPFADEKKGKTEPHVEHMWFSDINFNGEFVSGELLNAPNRVKSVKRGDQVRVRLVEISDWMYAVGGIVYGAHTVNLMRSRMDKKERKDHDTAWGLDFGDPAKVRLPTEQEQLAFCENLAESLKEHLKENPTHVNAAGDDGWTFLHTESLAGNAASVKVLLKAGADRNARTADGKTALDLAQSLGWDDVVKLLKGK